MNAFKDLRYKVLRILQQFTFVAVILATFSNIINGRPFFVTLQPILALFFILFLWYLEKKSKKMSYVSKLIFMIFFNVFYIPFAWIYSPGLSSAIGYYAILTVVLSVFFVEKKAELLLPLFTVIFSIIMIKFEQYNPDFFTPFKNDTVRYNDLLVNYASISLLIFGVISYINRNYVLEREYFYKQAITDELTGIYNRRALLDYLEKLCVDINRCDPFSLLFIDINHFKEINDHYGHHVGDEVLIKLGEILQKNEENCGRFGGDEFMAILTTIDENKINKRANRIKDEFLKYAKSNEFNNLSLSIGYTTSIDKNADQMIKEADAYMYKNKRSVKENDIESQT